MRTHLLAVLPVLFAALPAQAPTPGPDQVAAIAAGRSAIGGAPTSVLVDRPRERGPLWAIGSTWKAAFDERGTTVIPFFGSEAPRNFPLRLELAGVRVGERALALPPGEPNWDGAAVVTRRGEVTEVIAADLDQLEQSFVFDSLPERGAITVELAVDSELLPTALADGLRFANEHGHVDYHEAVAVDAAGRRLPLQIAWTGERIHIEIPADFVAEATLPLVLDPVLNFWFALGANPAQAQRDSDVASIQASGLNGRTLFVYRREWSASDHDAWAIMFDGGLSLVATDFALDFTSDDWLEVAVAGSNYAQNFMVVGEVRVPAGLGSLWFIAGRTVGAAGSSAVGPVFDIERDGVVGSGGNNFDPDVGGDPYFGVGRYTVVFRKHDGGAADIYLRQLTTSGGQVTTLPDVLASTVQAETRPSISKSCGQSNGLPAHWLVTWQRTYPFAPFDQEVYGRLINWNGLQITPSFPIAATVGEETAPSAGSPIDRGGVRYWPVVYELASAPGQPRDVVGRIIDQTGLNQLTFTVSNGVPAIDDFEPEVDSDGTRFVTVLTSGASIEAVAMAFLGTSVRVEERTGMQTSGAQVHGQGNVVADYSGGGVVSPRYFVTFTNYTTNTFNLVNYGGYSGGTFFTTRATTCGSLSMQVTGSPVIGQTITATVDFGPFSGTFVGVPASIPLNALGCSCLLGVDQIAAFGNPFVWTVPNDPQFVGIPLAIQGWTAIGSQCLGFLDLTDTVDFTVR